jgi:hypothetical protein
MGSLVDRRLIEKMKLLGNVSRKRNSNIFSAYKAIIRSTMVNCMLTLYFGCVPSSEITKIHFVSLLVVERLFIIEGSDLERSGGTPVLF